MKWNGKYNFNFRFDNNSKWHKIYSDAYSGEYYSVPINDKLFKINIDLFPKGIELVYKSIGGSLEDIYTKIIEHEIIDFLIAMNTEDTYNTHCIPHFYINAHLCNQEEDSFWKFTKESCKKCLNE